MIHQRHRAQLKTSGRRLLLSLAMVLLPIAAVPTSLEAQLFSTDRWAVVPTFGVVFPTGDMKDYVLPGPTFGVRLLRDLSPRISVGLETAFDSHQGNPASSHTLYLGPPYQMLRYGVAAEVALLQPSSGRFTIVTGVGGGLATMFSEPMYNPDAVSHGQVVGGDGQTEFTHDALQFGGTYPAFNGQLRVAYVYDPTTTLFIEGIGFGTNVDAEKTKVFAMGSYPVAKVGSDGRTLEFDERGPLEPPTSIVTLGVRLGFQLRW